MKKFLVLAALALFTVGFATQACAVVKVKVSKNLAWQKAAAGTLPGAPWATIDTQVINDEVLNDTTSVFSLQDAAWFGPMISDNWAAADTSLMGYIVIYTDSTADGASTLTDITGTIEASGDGNDWTIVGTTRTTCASDDPVVALPLLFKGADHINLVANAPMLRVRITACIGILASARAKLVYWKSKDYVVRDENLGWASSIPYTSRRSLATSDNVDTTAVFSLDQAVWGDATGSSSEFASSTTTDSMVAGFLVAYQDSSIDVASNATAVTITVDGSGDGNDWVVLGTVAGILASDDPIVCWPLASKLVGAISGDGNLTEMAHLLPLCPKLRVRFTTTTGTLVAAHLKLRYRMVPS